MKTLKRTRYNTMNSWNNTTAPAYNLKIYNVIDDDLQNKVFELMETENFYDEINWLIRDFDKSNDYEYQAGFNGRSGGYLVLYVGGCKKKTYIKDDFKNNNGNDGRVYISDRIGWKSYKEAKKMGIIDEEIITSVYTKPGIGIDEKDVPGDVLKRFRKLAVDIVKITEEQAKSCKIENIPTGATAKILVCNN